MSTRISLVIVGFVTSVIIARTLGPEGRGMFAMAVTLGAIGVQFTNLGLHGSNTYYASRDTQLLSPLLGNSLTKVCSGSAIKESSDGFFKKTPRGAAVREKFRV